VGREVTEFDVPAVEDELAFRDGADGGFPLVTQVTLLGQFFEDFRQENLLGKAWRGFVCPKPDVVKTYLLVSW